MVKFIIIMLLVLVTALVLIDIFNAIKYRNERVRAGIEIAKVKASYIFGSIYSISFESNIDFQKYFCIVALS